MRIKRQQIFKRRSAQLAEPNMRKRRHDTPLRAARAHGEEQQQQLHAGARLLRSTTTGAADSSHATKSAQFDTDAVAGAMVPVALAAIVLGVYVQTLYPSVAGGDSGELVAESCHLGVSHPPGYPLFNMVVHAFALLLPWDTIAPTTTVAWRANLFSALCDTVAAVLIYYCVLHWTPRQSGHLMRHVPALTAAALFGFSPLIWTYAVGAEVFALNNMFAALLVHTLLQYARHGKSLRTACVGAFVSSLALCNQHTIVLFEIPIVSWVLYTRRHTLARDHELLMLSAAFVAGLLPYLYMPLAMALHPQPGSWGDVTTLAGWFHHVRRGDYGTFRLFSTDDQHEDVWTRLRLYAVDLSTREVPLHLAAPVLALGVFATLQPMRIGPVSATRGPGAPTDTLDSGVGWLLLVTYTFYMLVFHALANLPLSEGLTYGVHMRFWQQPNVIVFLWLGVGLSKVLELATQLAARVSGSSSSSSAAPSAIAVLASALCLSLVGVQVATWFTLCDQSRAVYIRDYARALLDPLPRNAVLIVNFDLQWTALRYLQRCEHRRTDVTLLNLSMMSFAWFATKHAHYPTLTFPGTRLVPFGGAPDGFTFASFLDANYEPLGRARHKRRGIFFGGKLNHQDADLLAKYAFTPFGLLDELHRVDETTTAPELQLAQWLAAQQHVMATVHARLPALPPPELYSDETWEWTIARDYGMKTLSWSTFLLERTIADDPLNVTLLSHATHAMERAYQFEPQRFWSRVATLKNLGLAYAQIVKSNEAFRTDGADPFFNDAVGATVSDRSRYKDRASARMLEVWHEWLAVPEARQDPGFAAIQGVVRKFVPEPSSSTSDSAAPSALTSTRKTKKAKKHKAKKRKPTH